jgi:hypothetical protein
MFSKKAVKSKIRGRFIHKPFRFDRIAVIAVKRALHGGPRAYSSTAGDDEALTPRKLFFEGVQTCLDTG